jgi:hypothetical protein
VVVVDGSRDGTIEALEEIAATERRLKPVFIDNNGPAAARDAGCHRAGGDVILFIDDDVVPSPGLARAHALHHARRSGILVVGYMPVELPPVRLPGSFARYLYAEEYELTCAQYETDPHTILTGLWGGNFSLTRMDCLRVGLHSSDFVRRYPGHEDRDFGIRCHKAGVVGVFDRSLRAEHRYSTTPARFLADAREQGAARLLVHELHSDVIGPLDVDSFTHGLPRVVAGLVRLTRHRPLHAALTALLLHSLRICGTLRLFALETLAARVLRRIEQQQGALRLGKNVAVPPQDEAQPVTLRERRPTRTAP